MRKDGVQDGCRRDITARLKKIEGQIRGITRMVEDDRDCRDIMVQLTAVKAAISQVGAVVLTSYLSNCLGDDLIKDQAVRDNLDKFAELLKKWT